MHPIDEQLFTDKVAAMTVDDSSDENCNKNLFSKQMTKKNIRQKEKDRLQGEKQQILKTAKQAMYLKQISHDEVDKSITTVTETNNGYLEFEMTVKSQPDYKLVPTSEILYGTEHAEPNSDQDEERQIQDKLTRIQNIEVSPLKCIFSDPKQGMIFSSVEENIEHMWNNFGLYIPEPNYLVDKEGLITYLAEKVNFGFCICCSYQGRNSEAARAHIKSKRHTRIPYESEVEKMELSEFYDFSSTYDDYEEKINNNHDSDAEGWEDVSEEESTDDELPLECKDAIYRDGNELILPSGVVIGHRSMARYYRQNLPPDRILTEGQGTVIAAETRHKFGLGDKHKIAVQSRVWNQERKRIDQLYRKSQKFINNQPHFRDPLLQ